MLYLWPYEYLEFEPKQKYMWNEPPRYVVRSMIWVSTQGQWGNLNVQLKYKNMPLFDKGSDWPFHDLLLKAKTDYCKSKLAEWGKDHKALSM